MNSQNHHNQGAMPSWDFWQYLDPQLRASGQGVDHQDPPPYQFPFGGPFGFGGPRGHHPAGHPAPAGPHPWGPGPSWGGPRHKPWTDFSHPGRPRGEDEPSERGAASDSKPREPTAADDDEKADGSDRTVDDADPVADPAEVTPGEDERSPCGSGRRGGRRGCGRPRHARDGGPWAGRSHHHRSLSPSGWPDVLRGMMGHPIAQVLREQAQRYYAADANSASTAGANTRGASTADATSFTPPVDVYNTKTSYVVHVALPGARKEDLGVAWDPDTGRLRIAGVVHRPGDEQFLATLASGERRVGLFERHVALPPAAAAPAAHDDDDGGHADPVDADNISAKMEDGILVVVVPKLEKEWTQIRRVDIE